MRTKPTVLSTIAALVVAAALFAPYADAQQKPPTATDPNIACRNNLRMYGTSMMMYVQDYDGTFPPMQTAKQVQNRVRPYLKNDQAFYCPVTRLPYQPVKALSGKRASDIKQRLITPMLVEARPHTDGTGHIAFADGHVKSAKLPPRKTKTP